MSTLISHRENDFSLQLGRMPIDPAGRALLRRIEEVLALRSDLTKREFLRAIGRATPSWGSEFFNAQRTTNDLRLVMKMAKVLGVTVGYLLGESDRLDGGALILADAWGTLTDDRDRRALLNLAVTLRGESGDPDTEQSAGPGHGPTGAGDTTKAPKKRR